MLQAKNSKMTVIHEMMVEADTTGYIEPPIDYEQNDFKPEQLPESIEQAGDLFGSGSKNWPFYEN